MEKSVFDRALDYTFGNEGSYSDHPADRGGATSRYGITQEELARWRKHPVSKQDVKEMSGDEAKAIYEAWYWRPLGCDKISSPAIAICMFDIGVVRGIGVPPRYAQEICNVFGHRLVVDGKIGPKSLTAINQVNPKEFVQMFSAKARNGFLAIVAYRPSQAVFIRGWLNRAKRLLTLIA